MADLTETRTQTVLPTGTSDLDEFRALVERATDTRDYPCADSMHNNVPAYDCDLLRTRCRTGKGRSAVQTELADALLHGPGIVMLKRAFTDHSTVDRASEVFNALIEDQHESGAAAGDHFATPGANDRVWNALEKLAIREPTVFAQYYANDIIALVSSAWLGPGYQMTSQVNVVNPGGKAQTVHRDYHLGFQSDERLAQYPAHVHRLSPMLTLQGAIAHCDMPLESGPTLYLPYSHKYAPGYLACRRPEFREYFQRHHVQMPLAKGDAVFFNPALFHAAGENRSAGIKRMANLLQVSSPFGRAMESVDRLRMSNALFPALLRLKASGAGMGALRNVVAASAEDYPFPTNLDRDQPVGDAAPQTQADLVWRALLEEWPPDELRLALDTQARQRHSHDA